MKIQKNVNLKKYNTFGMDVEASLFATFSAVEELQQLILENKGQELFILGGGSNLLLTQNIDQLVLKNEIRGISVVAETQDDIHLKVGAGEVWHEFVLFCVQNNYNGVENLSLIPGNVGASPMQNIGAYGIEVKDVIIEVEALKISTGNLQTFSNEDCKFGYRESIFKGEVKGQYIITNVTFKLQKNAKVNTSYGAIEQELNSKGIHNPSIKDVSDAVISIRKSKLPDPAEIGNAGSFFKNPIIPFSLYESLKVKYPTLPSYPSTPGFVKVPAGWLIEQAAWKGKTFENYGVHKNQALVLVNYGSASGKQIWDLSTQIIADIQGKFGIELEREVNVYGI